MNKIIFLICSSLLFITCAESMNKTPRSLFSYANELSRKLAFERMQYNVDKKYPSHEQKHDWQEIVKAPSAAKNHLLQIIEYKTYEDYKDQVKQLVLVGADPNTIPFNGKLPLAIALEYQDMSFVEFLLFHLANPNLFTPQPPINTTAHQEAGIHPSRYPSCANKPNFYFAKTLDTAQLCIQYEAQAQTSFDNTSEYGNVLTHIFDHADYTPDLTKLYLLHGAQPYYASNKSNQGSTLHHLMNILENHNALRLLLCAEYLLENDPFLLQSKDSEGNTPGDLLNLNIQLSQPIYYKFIKLFDEHKTTLNSKRSKE